MSSVNYIAILGRQPELGLVELESIQGSEHVQPFGSAAAVVDRQLNVDALGGAIKVGEVLYRGEATALRNLPVDLTQLPVEGSKTPFAVSAYGSRESARDLIAAGLELKKVLKLRGSVRLITPSRGLAVSAAELHHNRVLEDGFELLVVRDGKEMIVARTTGVQNIDWYSKRDYERPVRSAKVGMLPPKLAQIIINTTKASVVFDPFCGTGVVCAEALLMGRESHGKDLSPEMVEATNANLKWLEAQLPKGLPHWTARTGDARLEKVTVGAAVVTEGYLGPNLEKSPNDSDISAIRRELLPLYRDCLSNWARQMPSGAEVTMCAPAWRRGNDWVYLGIVDELPRLGYTLKSFSHVRTPLVYGREDQSVGRQLLLMRKI